MRKSLGNYKNGLFDLSCPFVKNLIKQVVKILWMKKKFFDFNSILLVFLLLICIVLQVIRSLGFFMDIHCVKHICTCIFTHSS